MILDVNRSSIVFRSEDQADEICLRSLYSRINAEDQLASSPGEEPRVSISDSEGAVELLILTGE